MPNNLSLSWDILPERKAWSVQLFESIGEKSGISFGGSSNAGCGQLNLILPWGRTRRGASQNGPSNNLLASVGNVVGNFKRFEIS